jgi:5-(carboxyamino)imidazole ribonucleotide synthase
MWQDIKLGILGGGQLGAMLIRSAIDFGLKVSVLDMQEEAPAARFTNAFSVGDPMCYETVLAFGRTVDVLTIEKEAVNVEALQQLALEGIQVHPSPSVIGLIQDKWVQKKALEAAGIPVVPGILVLNREALYNHMHRLPGCLKLCTQGYDGKGVMMIRTEADIATAFDAPSVLEDLVAVKQELSVIIARNATGAVACYDPVMMIFDKERFVLDFQVCPAGVAPQIGIDACDIAMKVAEAVKLEGILAVEMFVTEEGQLLVNELAPRPHNSGHHTIEACATSQYEQHLRAILGLPLGDTRTLLPSVMINILEPAAQYRDVRKHALHNILGSSETHLHWYGKSSGQEGRKMGHITITDHTIEAALGKAAKIHHLMKHDSERASVIS